MFWKQRSSERWVLEGYVDSAFFHRSANGRRRKTKICSLESDQGLISDIQDIKTHVVSFYKHLFGAPTHKGVHLSQDFWDRGGSVCWKRTGMSWRGLFLGKMLRS
jgi:hypothetical protein